jgi:hypothetical protein
MAVMVSRTSALPENDLGVVGAGQTQEAPVIESDGVVIDEGESELSVGVDEPTDSDMPLMNSDSGDAASDGDMPVLDTDVIDNAVTEEPQAVTDGSDGEGPDTDGS